VAERSAGQTEEATEPPGWPQVPACPTLVDQRQYQTNQTRARTSCRTVHEPNGHFVNIALGRRRWVGKRHLHEEAFTRVGSSRQFWHPEIALLVTGKCQLGDARTANRTRYATKGDYNEPLPVWVGRRALTKLRNEITDAPKNGDSATQQHGYGDWGHTGLIKKHRMRR
jgi:hypothetical protein